VRGGLHPELVTAVVRRLGEVFVVEGADVTELAPPLKWHIPGEPARSTRTAAHYALAQLDALLAGETRLRDEVPLPAPATEEEVWSLPPMA
jgi:arginase family enzyme